ncbi:DUF4304 domain-containing protein [Flavobacterium okayamense]|uniref:DUF4304 domain-containing protein n=1 Tax=Flavobacterium okayamense TaxID=2830782 RepID=A0ABM7S707_9FLAO|nr:DUF4304 domain-containing protein [Flavobacterium okayamense]BCY27219.1 hypothetical protein KK2020170_00870 [Flavobacterium okayamense]
MISSTEFRKHISKILSGKLKELGFKGSGFNYIMDSEHFVFTIGIQASRYGGQCCTEFGIQPKTVDTNGYEKLNFKKLKYYNCEFRTRLSPKGQGDYWWKYSELENRNIEIANDILNVIEKKVIPIIDLFKSNNKILETIEVKDLDNMYVSTAEKLGGMSFGTSYIRMAWVLTKVFEKENPAKSKEFAKYALSKMNEKSVFFGIDYLKSIANKN